HELKTPITSIKGFIETLLTGAIDNRKDALHFLEIVAKHSDRLESIINDLLSLSRIEQESERKEVHLKEEYIRKVMDSAALLCGDKASGKHIRIDVDCDPGIRARINMRLMEQAVVNLLDNAIKYCREGGTVLLRGGRDKEDVFIAVEDQGTGIPEKHLARLFERFYRVDKARSRELGGTGLGLAIVKHIIQSHGGYVDVRSVIDQGSTFTLHLPDPLCATPNTPHQAPESQDI
ncbi:MAG: ATP-binding protein, partial [Planctomycetota bacterium]